MEVETEEIFTLKMSAREAHLLTYCLQYPNGIISDDERIIINNLINSIEGY